MMGGALIGLGSPLAQNAAPASTLESLYNAVNGHTGRAYFVLNGYGEALGTSPARAWTPRGADGVAEFVRSGNIWIDYCGWPMYYQNSVGGAQTQLGASGFGSFVGGIGYDWLSSTNFSPPPFTTNRFPFLRGYSLAASQNGVRYADTGSLTTDGGDFTIGGGTFPLAADGYTCLMALHHGSIGWYFYGSYGERAASSEAPNGVPVALYAAFIQACLTGSTTFQASFPGGSGLGTIRHNVYQAPTHPVTVNQPGPSSPYPQGGSSGSGSTSAGSTGSATVSTSTTLPSGTTSGTSAPGPTVLTGYDIPASASSGPSLLEVAGLAAGAGAVGLAVYLLVRS